MCSGEGRRRKERIAYIKLVGGLFGRREGWVELRVKEKKDREDREKEEALVEFWGEGERILAREERGESESVRVRVRVGKSRISSSWASIREKQN